MKKCECNNTKDIVEGISSAISSSLCLKEDYLPKLSGEKERTHDDVVDFQNTLSEQLFKADKEHTEIKIFADINDWGQLRDSADIWGFYKGYELIIELDATRADQVAKKIVSRFCYSILHKSDKPIIYVALLYQGTKSMNPEECKKYFKMGDVILQKINKGNILIGYIINSSPDCHIRPVYQTSDNNAKFQYNEDLVSEREQYMDFLLDENIKSIDNYMMPLNKIAILGDNKKQPFLDGLLQIKDSKDRYNFILDQKEFGYNNKKDLSKDQKSYWNKYIKYLSIKYHDGRN